MNNKKSEIIHELKHHFPLTLLTAILAGLIISVLFISGTSFSTPILETIFELFHETHILISAVATSALYYKYQKSKINTIIIGFLGAIIVGSVSDVLFPYIIGKLFLLNTSFHLPLIEEPIRVTTLAFVGAIIGLSSNKFSEIFKISHNLHVFLSILASLFYVLAFTPALNILTILLLVITVFLIVYIPCSVSDIIFPLYFIKKDSGCCVHSR